MENLLLLGFTACGMAFLLSAMLAVSLAHPPLNGFSRLSVRDTDPSKLAFFPAGAALDDPLPLLGCIPDTNARIRASSEGSASFFHASDASALA